MDKMDKIIKMIENQIMEKDKEFRIYEARDNYAQMAVIGAYIDGLHQAWNIIMIIKEEN